MALRALGNEDQCSGAQRAYTGAIAPAFGENVITHDCGCGASRNGDSSGAHVPAVLIGIAVGIAAAWFSGGATRQGGTQ